MPIPLEFCSTSDVFVCVCVWGPQLLQQSCDAEQARTFLVGEEPHLTSAVCVTEVQS